MSVRQVASFSHLMEGLLVETDRVEVGVGDFKETEMVCKEAVENGEN